MKKTMIGITATTALAACAVTPELAPAGSYTPDAEFSITLSEDWTYYSPPINVVTDGGMLTMDGPLLNRVHLMTLEPGDSLVKAVSKTDDLPEYTASQSPIANVEFLTASLDRMGYKSVESGSVEPIMVDSHDGIMVSVAAKMDNGLNLKGDAAMIEANGNLNVILFIAPAMHYYDELADDVRAMVTSMQFTAG